MSFGKRHLAREEINCALVGPGPFITPSSPNNTRRLRLPGPSNQVRTIAIDSEPAFLALGDAHVAVGPDSYR
jgi:hypothetical protein